MGVTSSRFNWDGYSVPTVVTWIAYFEANPRAGIGPWLVEAKAWIRDQE